MEKKEGEVVKARKLAADTLDYAELRKAALEDWEQTEAALLAAATRLRSLFHLIYLCCNPQLPDTTTLSVDKPFNILNGLRRALRRTEVK